MMTRRENLLEKPWLRRRYENHRKKVLSALPAVDSRPPSSHPHVVLKLKKLQKEEERLEEVVEGNLRLLERTTAIMRTKGRVDDRRTTTTPSFLHRVGIYLPRDKSPRRPSTSASTSEGSLRKQEITNGMNDNGIKEGTTHRCSVCQRRIGKGTQRILPKSPMLIRRPIHPEFQQHDSNKIHRRPKTVSPSSRKTTSSEETASLKLSASENRIIYPPISSDEVFVLSTLDDKLKRYKISNDKSKLQFQNEVLTRDRIVLTNDELSVIITLPNLASVRYSDCFGREKVLRRDFCECHRVLP